MSAKSRTSTTGDRFDFEQELLGVWNITTDIETVRRELEACRMSPDDYDRIDGMLLGVKLLYESKFDRLFNLFESLLVNKKL